MSRRWGPDVVTVSPANSARSAPSASSSRATRSAGGGSGWPMASCSDSMCPAPMPSVKRPPDSSLTVATSLASTAGCRSSLLTTIVDSATRSVTAAAAASAVIGGSTPGIRWSATLISSTPAASSCRHQSGHDAASATRLDTPIRGCTGVTLAQPIGCSSRSGARSNQARVRAQASVAASAL